jgi:hypothetical protein
MSETAIAVYCAGIAALLPAYPLYLASGWKVAHFE